MPFGTLVGHHRVLALLARAIARGTLPPSLLLAGPQGIGKRRTALAIAAGLLVAGYYGVLVTTAVDPTFLVSTTADRLLVQVWPTVVLTACTIGESSQPA